MRRSPTRCSRAWTSPGPTRRRALSAILFPGPFRDWTDTAERYGDVTPLPTRAFFYGLRDDEEVVVDLGPGVRLVFELEAVGEPDERGMRSVLVRLNGMLRPMDVRDDSVEVATAQVERADRSKPGHVAAPLAGVLTLRVQEGDEVEQGQPVGVLEAMKMESTVTAPVAGRIERAPVPSGTRLEQGDLIVAIEPS